MRGGAAKVGRRRMVVASVVVVGAVVTGSATQATAVDDQPSPVEDYLGSDQEDT